MRSESEDSEVDLEALRKPRARSASPLQEPQASDRQSKIVLRRSRPPRSNADVELAAAAESSPPTARERAEGTSSVIVFRGSRSQRSSAANGDPSADAAGGPAIQALQGRWKHSDKQFGMLTVTGKRVCFEETKNNSDLLPQHDGSVTLDGWLSRPETLRPEVVEWTLGAAGCNGRCEWYRCDAKEDLEPSRAAGSPEAQRSILVFRKRNPEKRAAPPDDVAEVSQPGLGAAVAAIQGRWEHSSLGMLAVDGMQVVFDRGITCNIVQMPDGSLNVGGFVSRPLGAAGALEQINWSMAGCDAECHWRRVGSSTEDANRARSVEGLQHWP
ncbi:unnamed protein product, partial [Polarella glacialis]